MEENLKYQPEYNLLQDAYLGSREVLQKKLYFLSNMAQEEKWDYKGTADKRYYIIIFAIHMIGLKLKAKLKYQKIGQQCVLIQGYLLNMARIFMHILLKIQA